MFLSHELSIPRKSNLASDEYFEEFPFLRLPFTKQHVFWLDRLLMAENNASSSVDFTLGFLAKESDELESALARPEYPDHVEDEGADVAVVSLIGLAFWNDEEWKSNSDTLIKYVKTAMSLTGLFGEQYATKINSVIQEKNSHNYLQVAFEGVGDKSKAPIVYEYTASHLKDVRNVEFGGRFPSDANIVFKHRNNGAAKLVGSDRRYVKLLSVGKEIDRYRDIMGVSKIR